MRAHPRPLPIPESAAHDAKAVEMVRVWAAGGRQHVSLATDLWEDPANWGIMLVDLAKHVANAYEQTMGIERSVALERLKAGLDAEWGSATDEPKGGRVDR
jgi:hypothetical protein